MRRITLANRLRYWFDNTMARGTVALIGWLFVLLAALVVASALVVYATGVAPEVGGHRPGFLQTLWLNLMRAIDPGNVGGDEGSWPFMLSMLAITAGGILVFSTLIGVIFTGIDNKLDELRKGRSLVVERGHTVIYGWSSRSSRSWPSSSQPTRAADAPASPSWPRRTRSRWRTRSASGSAIRRTHAWCAGPEIPSMSTIWSSSTPTTLAPSSSYLRKGRMRTRW